MIKPEFAVEYVRVDHSPTFLDTGTDRPLHHPRPLVTVRPPNDRRDQSDSDSELLGLHVLTHRPLPIVRDGSSRLIDKDGEFL